MKALVKLFVLMVVLAMLAVAAGFYWVKQPIIDAAHPSIEFSIAPGSSGRALARQIADAGVPVNPELFALLARLSGKSSKMKAGNYELKPGTTPLRLLDQLVRGEFAQEALAIIEGWTFKQMREAIAEHPALKHDTVQLSDRELMEKIDPDYKTPEGMFFPDTYLFAKGASEMQIYRQAHSALLKRLNEAWENRDKALPYKTPYEALTMASIIEKETGMATDRSMVAGVFVNRLKRGMLLQTDPTVIYGMGDRYKGVIHKSDLERDTPYNTYTRAGLPPTPISLPGKAALAAALNPAKTDALYFVSRGNGSSEFSSNLNDHNRAVSKYQR
jgi:UPF0755 protein